MSVTKDLTTVWAAPLRMMIFGTDAVETLVAAQRVVAARSSVIASAWVAPMTADHAELVTMVTEKIDAFGRAAKVAAKDVDRLRSRHAHGAATMRRVHASAMVMPWDLWAMWADTLAQAAIMIALPGRALQPVHRTVTANARRLR